METGNQPDVLALEEDSESDTYDLRTEIEHISGTSDFTAITKLELSKFGRSTSSVTFITDIKYSFTLFLKNFQICKCCLLKTDG